MAAAPHSSAARAVPISRVGEFGAYLLGNRGETAGHDVPDALHHKPGTDPEAGDRFGRYRLIELVGKGGMAEVFRAAAGEGGQPGDRTGFVIKRIRPDRSDSPAFVQMFCDEARISALLDHPNIVRVFDFGQIDGAYFMAMEYLDGHDLGAVLHAARARRTVMALPVAALVARDVARALQHAHAATLPGGGAGGIVHRDVSPGNVMLLWSGGVKILDFGIAKAAALARPGDGGPGERPPLAGHLRYLAPEQIRGLDVDCRADVFSLGVVLWEMLTGDRLFAGKAEFETMRNVLHHAIDESLASIPLQVQGIVGRALQRDPDHRYQTAGEMADELDGFLAGHGSARDAVASLLRDLFGSRP
jgi:eukaryotic-like serine/threonine-protein kinase